MKVTQFLASLLPSFGKETITDDIRLTRTEIVEHTQPAYDAAVPLFKGWKFKSVQLDAQLSIWQRMVKSPSGENIVTTIQKGFKPMLENLEEVEGLIVRTFNAEIAGGGISYLKANLLQFCECATFVSKYARKFLTYVYICETAEYADSGTDIAESLSPAELEWISANFVSFCLAFNIVTGNPVHIKKQLADIPDVVVTSENAHTLGSTIGETKIDPFQMKLIPIWLNPIYHVGMFVAEWQADRYKAAKEEVKLLELRKLNLEKAKEGKSDAGLQKQIIYMEGRIQGLNFKIAKMEKAHG